MKPILNHYIAEHLRIYTNGLANIIILIMSKGNSRFCQAAFLEKSSQTIFTKLAKFDYLKNAHKLSKSEFAHHLAYFKSELIALHPFYELNGRITRLFFDLIALSNDYQCIDYSTVDPSEYILASIHCVQFADFSNMEKLILNGLTKR